MAEKLVIIGNGMAPGRMLEHLFEYMPDRFEVTIFNAEPRVNYDRIMLSPVLSGEKSFEDIIIHGDGWYIDRNITLHKGHKVTKIDRKSKIVTSDAGVSVTYDKLVIATGSVPFILPLPGTELQGVLTYRDLDDVNAMLVAAKSQGKAVVIGGGLLGLEAAAGLKARGMEVTVIHLPESLMERQLDPEAGLYLQKELELKGINIITGANSQKILGDKHVTGLRLEDGRIIDADLIVMAVGIKPNISLALDAGLETGRGIHVDEYMHTTDPNIISLGECAEFAGTCYGLVAPLYDMAKIAAHTLCDVKDHSFSAQYLSTKLKVTGVDLYSAGDFQSAADREELVLRDKKAGVYKRLVLKENKIIGVVLYGDTSDGPYFFDLLKSQRDISSYRDVLLFGESYLKDKLVA